jgi:outer membrane protein OmpA-like peptidoglycan-associated protein
MRCQLRHLILPALLLVPFLIRSQQRIEDTLILHFRFDSYQIQPADVVRLNAIRHPGNTDSTSIIGYTDATGTPAYNQRLSWQRANAAARLLATARSHASGGGIAPTPERSDSENRRVEIVFYYTLPHFDTVTRRTAKAGTVKTTRPVDSIVVVKGIPAPDSSGIADSTHPAAILALRRINFIVDTPIPTDSTRRILPQFIAELEQYKDHHLEIDGYVNSLVPLHGTDDKLFILSVRRAKFIYDCLVNAGFDPGKLTYKGMGNASPINPTPTTREEMNANMRVEIKVY